MTLCARRHISFNPHTGKRMPPAECRLGLHLLGTGMSPQQAFDVYANWLKILKPRVWRHVTECTITDRNTCPLARFVPMAEKPRD